MDKKLLQIQVALFFGSDYNGLFEDLSKELKKRLGESKTTQQIPLPSHAPSEIPRLILNYDRFNINVAKNRIDLFSKNFESIKNIVPCISDILLDKLKFSIKRIGFVKSFFIERHIESVKNLLPKEKVDSLDIKEISLRVNIKDNVDDYRCNNIETINKGIIIEDRTKKEGIIIKRDINTFREDVEKNKFRKVDIDDLLFNFDSKTNHFILI